MSFFGRIWDSLTKGKPVGKSARKPVITRKVADQAFRYYDTRINAQFKRVEDLDTRKNTIIKTRVPYLRPQSAEYNRIKMELTDIEDELHWANRFKLLYKAYRRLWRHTKFALEMKFGVPSHILPEGTLQISEDLLMSELSECMVKGKESIQSLADLMSSINDPTVKDEIELLLQMLTSVSGETRDVDNKVDEMMMAIMQEHRKDQFQESPLYEPQNVVNQ